LCIFIDTVGGEVLGHELQLLPKRSTHRGCPTPSSVVALIFLMAEAASLLAVMRLIHMYVVASLMGMKNHRSPGVADMIGSQRSSWRRS
jgi:hypothetical protein